MLCLIYDWKWGDLHDCTLFQSFTKKKNHFLSQWPWIKASYDKSWRTFTVQKALSNSSVVKQLPWCPLHPTKLIYFWCLCLLDLGSGNHADFLRKDYQTYIELRYSLSYRTELVGSHLNSGDKWNLPKQNSWRWVKILSGYFLSFDDMQTCSNFYSQPCLCCFSRDHRIVWVIQNNVISQCSQYIVCVTSVLITCILKDYQLPVYPYSQLKMTSFYCFLRYYLFSQHFYIHSPKSYMVPHKHKYPSLDAKWMDLHF